MSSRRAATIVPLPAADADYRLLVPVMKSLAGGVDTASVFEAAGRALQTLAPFDWMALSYRAERGNALTLHRSLPGRPAWLASSQPLDVSGRRDRAWFLPDVPRIVGAEGVRGISEDVDWPVPHEVGALLTIPLPAGAGGQRRDAQRARRRGALVLGRTGGDAFEPSLLSLLEPCVAHIVVLLERLEWLEGFRATNAELRGKVAQLEQASTTKVRTLRRTPASTDVHEAPRWVAVDPGGREALEIVERAAETDLPVLLHGESGTGKELLSRTLHRMSQRSDGAFIAVNVATLRPELAASELFGHVQGAFTDARGNRRGLLQEADGGTLFLDEIGDMPAAIQPALLRFLEDGFVRPVGGNDKHRVDVRVVCATHRDLRTAIAQGDFRQDLYHRLAGVVIDVPPLRDRPADLLPLALRFLEEASEGRRRELPPAWMPALRAWSWPGNVREVRNSMRAVAALSRGPDLETRFLPQPLRGLVEEAVQAAATDGADYLLHADSVRTETALEPVSDAPTRPSRREFDGWTLVEVEREMLRRTLNATSGHRGRAAAQLGISPRALYDKIKRLGVEG
ncbi:MAG: sigma-54-dependent Fis family transcriptional regulator [Deltaproteobacteria bacterium]|nr:sigma-54-dependent Fis family transcriptional regulator [Deltaproteobacteria bacterium]